MKKIQKIIFGFCIVILLFVYVLSAPSPAAAADSVSQLPDGTHRGTYVFDWEPYTATVELKIKNGKITDVSWIILDTQRNVPFDSTYERFMGGNALYIDQCRRDWKGSKTYGPKLIQVQNVDSVDAVTGATWTHMLFKRAVKDALKLESKAKK
jgi:major membrane immunogen (membrane-anchored lipoprotein)